MFFLFASLLLFQVWFEEEWGKRNEGADEDEGGSFDGPFSLFHSQVEKDQKKGEDDAVDHAGDSYGGVVTKDPFFVDRKVEENDK